MLIHKNDYSHIIHQEDKSVLQQIWQNTSYLMQRHEYRTNIMEWTKSIQQFKPKRILIDTKNFIYLITSDLQEWTSQTISKVMQEVGVEKIALVKSDDLFVQMAMEDSLQTIQNTNPSIAKAKFFEHQVDALQWLCKN